MAVEEMTVNGTALNQSALLSELSGLLGELREDVSKLQQRVQFASQLDTVRETICEEYVDQFLRGDYSSEHLVSAFENGSIRNGSTASTSTRISGRSTQTRWNGTPEDFRSLDQEQQELAKIEVQHLITNQRPTLNLQHAASSEQVLLRREAEKQRRHKPLRELFDEAGSLITQLTPCFAL